MMELTEKDLELIDKEFITDQFDTYESDLVYKVNTKKGSVYLFFLLELQSYNDFTMPFRLLVYITAIWLDYFKNCDKDARRKKSFRLPAVIPIVLHNGGRSWTASSRFKEMIDKAELFGNYVVDLNMCWYLSGIWTCQKSDKAIRLWTTSSLQIKSGHGRNGQRTCRSFCSGSGRWKQKI